MSPGMPTVATSAGRVGIGSALLPLYVAILFLSAFLLFRRAANVHQDGAASSRRLARGVEHGGRVLSGDAARGIPVCAPKHAPAGAAPPGDTTRRRTRARPHRASHRRRSRLDHAAGGRGDSLADRTGRRLHRPAVLRRIRDGAAPATLVCPHRSCAVGRSVLPLRRQQPWQPCRSAQLPRGD